MERISRQDLAARRQSKRSLFLVTGGTGFLGSHLIVSLLKEGYPMVLLVRPERGHAPRERVARLLQWFGRELDEFPGLQVLEGSIDQSDLGLERRDYDRLRREVDEIIHCASSTAFSERKREELEETNIEGLRRMARLAAEGRCSFFHHISTAYAAGRGNGRCKEAMTEPDRFTNPYEETKCRGERVISKICREEGIRLNIYRPSIVYGDSRTGRSLRFNAVYYPVKTIRFLQELFEQDIKSKGGQRAQRMGIRLDDDGFLYLPIRIEVRNRGGVNLIPINFFVEAFLAIFTEALEGGLFHIVNNELKKIEDLIEYTCRLFKIKGIRPVYGQAFAQAPRNGLEILFNSYIEIYEPYLRDTRNFENTRAELILRPKGIRCPDFDYEIFSRCMQYAIETGWGKRLPL